MPASSPRTFRQKRCCLQRKTLTTWDFPIVYASSNAIWAQASLLLPSDVWTLWCPIRPTSRRRFSPRYPGKWPISALALDGGADGNDILRRLLPWTMVALRPGGGFAFELHETRLVQAADLARQAGFAHVRIVDDLAGRPRVLTARKPV